MMHVLAPGNDDDPEGLIGTVLDTKDLQIQTTSSVADISAWRYGLWVIWNRSIVRITPGWNIGTPWSKWLNQESITYAVIDDRGIEKPILIGQSGMLRTYDESLISVVDDIPNYGYGKGIIIQTTDQKTRLLTAKWEMKYDGRFVKDMYSESENKETDGRMRRMRYIVVVTEDDIEERISLPPKKSYQDALWEHVTFEPMKEFWSVTRFAARDFRWYSSAMDHTQR